MEAYCFNGAVHVLGSAMEADLSAVEGKTKAEVERKQDRILRRYLPQAFAQQFADTSALRKR